MAYTRTNYATGKAVREAVREQGPGKVQVYQPGPFGPDVPDGDTVIEGPHYPQPHRFYLRVTVKDGAIEKVHK